MGSYRLFIDGLAVGILLALVVAYFVTRFRQSRENPAKNEIDQLIEDLQDDYRKVEEAKKADPYDDRGI